MKGLKKKIEASIPYEASRNRMAYVTKYVWVTKYMCPETRVGRRSSGVVATLKRISPSVDGLRLRADASSGTAFAPRGSVCTELYAARTTLTLFH